MAALQRELPSHPLMSVHRLDTSLTCSFISLSLFPLDYWRGQLRRIKVLSGRMLWTSLMSLADTIWHSMGSSSVMHERCQWTADESESRMQGEPGVLNLLSKTDTPLYTATPLNFICTLHVSFSADVWCPCIVVQRRPRYRLKRAERVIPTGREQSYQWVDHAFDGLSPLEVHVLSAQALAYLIDPSRTAC